MIKYITEFLREFEFDTSDRIDIAIAYEKIASSPEAIEALNTLISGYDKDSGFITDETYSYVVTMAKAGNVHPYTAELIAHICLSRTMRERLLKLGFNKKNVSFTLLDYKIKTGECKRMFGTVGIYNWQWYTRFYGLRILGVGRLQFEVREFLIGTYKKGDKVIEKHDSVLSVHIPRTGTPLDARACQRSYAEAKEIFCKLLGCDNIPFFCSSWLLYHKNRDFLDEKSNIVKFMNNYEILKYDQYTEGNNGLYKFLYEVPNDTPLEKLPTDTTLRASYAAHMANGGETGCGTGIFFLE